MFVSQSFKIPKTINSLVMETNVTLPPAGATIADVQKMSTTDFKNMPVSELAGLILNPIRGELEPSEAPVQSERKERTAREISELADILQPYQQTMTPKALGAMITAIRQNNMTNQEIADFAKTFQMYQKAMK